MSIEGFTNKDKAPTITPEQVVTLFSIEGRSNMGAQMLLEKWMDQEFARRDAYEVTETEVYLARAKILRDAGFVQEAIDCFNDVALQAYNDFDDDLENDCKQEIQKLKLSL